MQNNVKNSCSIVLIETEQGITLKNLYFSEFPISLKKEDVSAYFFSLLKLKKDFSDWKEKDEEKMLIKGFYLCVSTSNRDLRTKISLNESEVEFFLRNVEILGKTYFHNAQNEIMQLQQNWKQPYIYPFFY